MTRSAQELSDIADLTEVTYRYAYALDDRDWAVLADLFVDDVELDYGLGETNVIRGLDAFIARSRAALEQMDATHHMFTNHIFEIVGDRARAKYYMHAQHMKKDEPDGALHTLGGIYEDEFKKTKDGWKITRRTYRAIWGRGNNAFNPGFRSDGK